MQSIVSAQELAEERQYPRHLGGTYRFDKWGRLWVYFQAEEALVQGDALEVSSYAAIDADVDAAAAADTRRVNATGDFTTTALVGMFGLDTNHEEGGHVYTFWVDDTATQNQGGPIIQRVDNDNIDVYFVHTNDGLIGTAFTTSTDYIVYTLSRLSKAATIDVSRPVGFVQRQGGFTDEYWGWALVRGQGVALIDTSDGVLAGGDKFITGTDDGTIQGAASATAAEGYYGSGNAILDSDSDGLVPICADCEINIAPYWVPGNLSVAYPGGVL